MPSALVKQVARARKVARQRGLRADLSWSEWLQSIQDFDGKCAYCSRRCWTTIDHFIPLAHGGPTSIDNCLPSCSLCNRQKGACDPDESGFPSALIERLRQYLAQRGRGQHGWPPQQSMQREEGVQQMNTKETQWKAKLQAEGKEMSVFSGDQHISIQLYHKGIVETDPLVRVRASLLPTEAVALAVELLRAAAPQLDQLQANTIQTALQTSEMAFSWPGKL